MPRARPKRNYLRVPDYPRDAAGGHRAPWSGRIQIAAARFEELVEICAVPDEQTEVFREAIETALGTYHRDALIFDQGPRPASILAALAPVEEHARKLRQALVDLNPVSCLRLGDAGVELMAAIGELDVGESDADTDRAHRFFLWMARHYVELLVGAAAKARKQLEGTESRHRPTNKAMWWLVHNLRTIFGKFAQIDLEPAEGEPPLRPNRLRLEFVALVLEAANECLPKPAIDPETGTGRPPWTLKPIEYSESRLARMLDELDRRRDRLAVDPL